MGSRASQKGKKADDHHSRGLQPKAPSASGQLAKSSEKVNLRFKQFWEIKWQV
jgi:hypothetical protein